MNFIAFHCDQDQHYFARSGEDEINAYHSDDSLCSRAEFNLRDLLNDELPTAYTCPWCDKNTLDTEHMRACSGYKKPYTREEIMDAYSDPTDRAKRDSMLASLPDEEAKLVELQEIMRETKRLQPIQMER